MVRDGLGYGFGIALLLGGILTVVLWVAAIVSILRSTYPFSMKLVFILLVILAPIVGSLAWFFIVRKFEPGRSVYAR